MHVNNSVGQQLTFSTFSVGQLTVYGAGMNSSESGGESAENMLNMQMHNLSVSLRVTFSFLAALMMAGLTLQEERRDEK